MANNKTSNNMLSTHSSKNAVKNDGVWLQLDQIPFWHCSQIKSGPNPLLRTIETAEKIKSLVMHVDELCANIYYISASHTTFKAQRCIWTDEHSYSTSTTCGPSIASSIHCNICCNCHSISTCKHSNWHSLYLSKTLSNSAIISASAISNSKITRTHS